MRPRTFEKPNGNINILPAMINPKFLAARNCAVPSCESCMLERAKKRSANTNKVNPPAEKEGDFFSTDQFFCKTPGCLPTGYRKGSCARYFKGGTINNNSASSLISVENQFSLGSNDTVMGK